MSKDASNLGGKPMLRMRAIDMVEMYGNERVWLNSACDWGVSDPLAGPKTALEMKRRGHTAEAIDQLVYCNPVKFLQQCSKFTLGGSKCVEASAKAKAPEGRRTPRR